VANATSAGACAPCAAAAPGFGCAAGSTSPTPTLCAVGFFCAGGAAGATPCVPATACPRAGLAAQPACYWNVSTLAGNGTGVFADGNGAAAAFHVPRRMSIDGVGNIVVADSFNNRVRRVTLSGAVTTLAGRSAAGAANGVGTAATFTQPNGVAMLADGRIAVAGGNGHTIRLISASLSVSTLAGSGSPLWADGTGAEAAFNVPYGVAQFANGDLVVADYFNRRVRVVTLAGVVTTLAGNGTAGYADGMGSAATLTNPIAVAVDDSDRAYVAAAASLRVVTRAGAVTTLAGSSAAGFADGAGAAAEFHSLHGVFFDAAGNAVVTDGPNRRVRLVTPAGLVATLAGNGTSSYEDGFGTAATFKFPHALSVDPAGDFLVVAELTGCVIRRVALLGLPVVA
jgi:hypothetical protein